MPKRKREDGEIHYSTATPSDTWPHQVHDSLKNLGSHSPNSHSPNQAIDGAAKVDEVILGKTEPLDALTLKPGDTVELKDGTFLYAKSVSGGEYKTLRGLRLERCEALDAFFPDKSRYLNELCWTVGLTPRESRRGQSDKDIEVSAENVKARRTMHFTNRPFEDINVHTVENTSKMSPTEIALHAALFCRIKLIGITNQFTPARHFYETVLRNLDPMECEDGYRAKLSTLRENWYRGPPGESSQGSYTAGDAFCGCGGISCGMKMAGIDVKWCADINPQAVKTCKRNHPEVSVHEISVHELCSYPFKEIKVDILHMSPMCCYFSRAHTTKGKNDELNSATLFCIEALTAAVKPRVVTLEQVPGLLQTRRHSLYFFMAVRSFLALNYSVRWKLFDCADYGLPQHRQRLIMMAARPGETLPPFPKPTHGKRASLKPYMGLESILPQIPPTASHHTIDDSIVGDPYPMESMLPSLITTNGGNRLVNRHPSGRALTIREFAACQSFPTDYHFPMLKTKALAQIGNAVPPIFGRALFQEVVDSLKQSDRIDLN